MCPQPPGLEEKKNCGSHPFLLIMRPDHPSRLRRKINFVCQQKVHTIRFIHFGSARDRTQGSHPRGMCSMAGHIGGGAHLAILNPGMLHGTVGPSGLGYSIKTIHTNGLDSFFSSTHWLETKISLVPRQTSVFYSFFNFLFFKILPFLTSKVYIDFQETE